MLEFKARRKNDSDKMHGLGRYMEALKENLDSGEAESETASGALQSSTTFAEGTESHSSHDNIPTARQAAQQLRSPTGTSSKLTCTMCWALRIPRDPQFQMPVAALAGFKIDFLKQLHRHVGFLQEQIPSNISCY